MSDVREPKILLFDIENTPNIAYTWGKWQQDVRRFQKEWWMLCFGWKWYGKKATHVESLPDFPRYEKDRTDDRQLVLRLRDLINEADVVVAHNGDGFDMPKARARWLVHGIDPPHPVKQIDTLKIARRNFMFNSNSLGDLGETLGLGSKGDDGGFDTWLGCMAGDPKAWARMTKYCKQDVVLLEKIYTRLIPWMPTAPNLALLTGRPEVCPKCGSDAGMIVRGLRHNGVTSNVQYQCKACRGYVRSRLADPAAPKPLYKP